MFKCHVMFKLKIKTRSREIDKKERKKEGNSTLVAYGEQKVKKNN